MINSWDSEFDSRGLMRMQCFVSFGTKTDIDDGTNQVPKGTGLWLIAEIFIS